MQAMRKAPLSRALAKSREARERGMRSGKEWGTQRAGGQRIRLTHNTYSEVLCLFFSD